VTSILLAILMSQRWDHALSTELTLPVAVAIEASVCTIVCMAFYHGSIACFLRFTRSVNFRLVGLGEDPGILAIRAPGLFGVRP
jgi:hypothetical protein